MEKTYLFFDTETTGLPDFRMPPAWEGQPHICQIGAILTDNKCKVKAELNLIIRPEGWSIPDAAAAIHGISQADAEKYGVGIKGALSLFNRLLTIADCVVAHNIKFDDFMIEREYAACAMQAPDKQLERVCTLELAKPILKIPPTEKMLAAGFTDFKSPNLQEAHKFLFEVEFVGAHDAMADVRACRDVFFELAEAA